MVKLNSLHIRGLARVISAACGSIVTIAVLGAQPPATVTANATTRPTGNAKPVGIYLQAQIDDALKDGSYQASEVLGGAFGNMPFQEVADHGLLVGLHVGLGKFFDKDVIHYVQPIYLTPTGEQFGSAYGVPTAQIFTLHAPPGCAVAAASIRGGGGLDAITLKYMRIGRTRLDPRHSFVTERIGSGGGSEAYLGGDGTPIIGICGRCKDDGQWLGLGFVFLHPTPSQAGHARQP